MWVRILYQKDLFNVVGFNAYIRNREDWDNKLLEFGIVSEVVRELFVDYGDGPVKMEFEEFEKSLQ